MRDLMTTLARRIVRQLRRDERGAIGVLVAVLLGVGVLTGMGALVVDVGELYQVRAAQQDAADAAALGVAKSCLLGWCDSSVAAHYADANASALTGGSAGVSLVCGSGAGLTSCPTSAAAATDQPAAGRYQLRGPVVRTAPIRSIISTSNGLGVAKLNRNDPSPPAPNAGPSTTLTFARSVTSTPGDSARPVAVQSSQARYVPSGGR